MNADESTMSTVIACTFVHGDRYEALWIAEEDFGLWKASWERLCDWERKVIDGDGPAEGDWEQAQSEHGELVAKLCGRIGRENAGPMTIVITPMMRK